MRSQNEYDRNAALEEARRRRKAEARRRHRRNQRIFYGACLLILILIIVCIGRGCHHHRVNKAAEIAMAAQQTVNDAAALALPKDTVVTIAAVGDIMVYDEQLADAESGGSYDFSPVWADVATILNKADLTVGNLETTFCGQPYSGYPNFQAPEALAQNLAAAGFDLLQTANTYSIQNGIAGLTSTKNAVKSAGMDAVGTYSTAAEAAENGGVVLKEVDGIKIAFIAFTKGCNNMTLPEGSESSVNLLYEDYATEYSIVDDDAILASITAAKALSPDIVIAMVHWGSEYELEPSETQEEIADLMFQNGVDVILGSHSHQVGPMETRTVTTADGVAKQVFLAYSLGNFMSNAANADSQTGVILNLQLTKDGDTGLTAITGATYTPTYYVDNGEEAEQRYQIRNTYAEMEKYIAGADGHVEAEVYDAMNDSIQTLHTNAGEAYDKGE